MAPTTISAMFPSCCPKMLPIGSELWPRTSSLLIASSPRKIPGHQRSPKRYSAAMPTPAGGQTADTEAVYRSDWPIFADA